MANTYIVQRNGLTVIIDGQINSIDKSHVNFQQIRDAVVAGEWKVVEDLIDVRKAISNFSEGNIVVDDQGVFYKDEELNHVVCDRILSFMEQEVDFKPLVKFLERLMLNPSRNSVDQLYLFLENKNIPIDEDGYILAYKSVRRDYKDYHSGRYDNSVGTENSMPRRNVDNDPSNHCSSGFHVGALGYVRNFGSGDKRVVICKVDPADVVSVPNDHDCQKMRVSRYKVIADYTDALPDTVYLPADEWNNDEGW